MEIIAQLAAIITLLVTSTSSSTAASFPIAKGGCQDRCGEVQIPYPFGIGEGCYLNDEFKIDCPSSSDAVTIEPFLLYDITSDLNVSSISLDGYLGSFTYVHKNCYNESGLINVLSDTTLTLGSTTAFTLNSTANILVVIGCDDIGFFTGSNSHDGRPYLIGCTAFCDTPGDITNYSCSGIGCCQSQIPWGQSKLNISLESGNNHIDLLEENPCSYAFLIEKDRFNFSTANLTNLRNVDRLPMVLDWVVGTEKCEDARKNITSYACKWSNTICQDLETNIGYRCACRPGFEGNPYLAACTDIKECDNSHICGPGSVCQNIEGNYTCNCNEGYEGDGKNDENGCKLIDKGGDTNKYYKIVAGTSVGVVFILIVSFLLYTEKRKRRLQQSREKFFRDNGGLLLQQQLSTREGGQLLTKIFSIDELKRATNNFDGSGIIGQGGFGTVYKGYLADNSVIAIKKSKGIDHNQIDSFINEVIILSKINHRNVVKLLGCCLETEIPLLVYEFVDNGTLFEHVHDIKKSSRLLFQMRLKIAAESAGVLSYLHSAASPPIIHRDIKSANILLDQNYTAKVADFGISRINMSDEAEISTMVQGTIGYLDPEYMLTSQLTEKSDVYSFGVMLIELFTGKRVLSLDRPEEERSIANYFLSMLKNDSLGDILDRSISNEGTKELLAEIAILAKRCISIIGDDRPTMKEVALELEGLRSAKYIDFQMEPNEEVEPLISMEASSSYKFDVNSINASCSIQGITELFPIKDVGGR